MEEKRSAARMPETLPAMISFRDSRKVPTNLPCLVQDLSKEGARVMMREPHVVPFEFYFTTAGGTPRKARKVWVKLNEMGLQYTG